MPGHLGGFVSAVQFAHQAVGQALPHLQQLVQHPAAQQHLLAAHAHIAMASHHIQTASMLAHHLAPLLKEEAAPVPSIEEIVEWLEKAYEGAHTPAGEARAEPLKEYWTTGKGGAKIRWGSPGDFDRCVRELEKHMPGRAKGYCFAPSTRVLPARSVVTHSEPTSRGDGLAAAALAGASRRFAWPELRGAYDRYYIGQVVVLRVATGHEVTVTPNHPIATRGGWVAAANLQVGDYVLCSSGPEWEVGAVIDPNVDHIPPTIEQVAESLSFEHVSVSRREDFHGDGIGSEVYEFRSDADLSLEHGTAFAQQRRELSLSGRDVPRGGHWLAGTSDLDARFAEHASYALAAEMQMPRDPDGGFSVGVPRDNLLLQPAGASASHGVGPAMTPNMVVEGAMGPTQSMGDLARGLAASIAAQQIVSIDRKAYAGHVYNLDTADGWYVASSIIAHNCNLLHHRALGIYPATHAKLDRAGEGTIKKTETSLAERDEFIRRVARQSIEGSHDESTS